MLWGSELWVCCLRGPGPRLAPRGPTRSRAMGRWVTSPRCGERRIEAAPATSLRIPDGTVRGGSGPVRGRTSSRKPRPTVPCIRCWAASLPLAWSGGPAGLPRDPRPAGRRRSTNDERRTTSDAGADPTDASRGGRPPASEVLRDDRGTCGTPPRPPQSEAPAVDRGFCRRSRYLRSSRRASTSEVPIGD